LSFDGLELDRAGTDGLAASKYRAGATYTDTATVFGAGKRKVRAQDPEQRAIVVGMQDDGFTVQRKKATPADRFELYAGAHTLAPAPERNVRTT
jgi:hypothetical protein